MFPVKGIGAAARTTQNTLLSAYLLIVAWTDLNLRSVQANISKKNQK